MSKMKGMIDQVLDEIMVEEGGDTEVTVALVRKYWDEVHPGVAVPAPGTVRNNLEQLAVSGRLVKLPNNKSWAFATPEDVTPPLAGEDIPTLDLVVFNKATAHRGTPYCVSVRIAPEAKTPYVVVRMSAELGLSWERAVLAYDKKREVLVLLPSMDGYLLRNSGEGDIRTFRMIGAPARDVFDLLGISANTTLYYNKCKDYGEFILLED